MGKLKDKYYRPTYIGLSEALFDNVPLVRNVMIDDANVGLVSVYIQVAWWTFGLINWIAYKKIKKVFFEVLPVGVLGNIEYVGIKYIKGGSDRLD